MFVSELLQEEEKPNTSLKPSEKVTNLFQSMDETTGRKSEEAIPRYS